MKRLLVLLLCLPMLFACGGKPEAAGSLSYENFPFGADYTSCMIGERVYSLYYRFHVYDADGGTVGRGLCRDPLCEHGSASCPDFFLRTAFGLSVATDGRELCFGATTFESDGRTGRSERRRAVYAVRPDIGEMRKVCEIPSTGPEFQEIQYADGMLWFMGAFYNEDYDPSSGSSEYADQYAEILCVKPSGGAPKPVTGERFSVDDCFYTDGKTLWVEGRSTGTLRACSIEEHEASGEWTDCRPDGFRAGPMCLYEDAAFLIASPADEGSAAGAYTDIGGRVLCPLSVFRLASGTWERIADDVTSWSYRFADGALWYEPFAAESYGVRDSWNGAETVPMEWVKNGKGTLRRVDLHDGSVKEWTSEDGRSIHPLAICGEGENLVVWSLLEDYAAFVESDGQRDTEIRKLRLREDGVAVIEATAGDLRDS